MSAAPLGRRRFALPNPEQGGVIEAWALYPTDVESTDKLARLGPYRLPASSDAPLAGQDRRLVLISHGSGGAPWTLRHLALGLAQAGYVVALPKHPGNSVADDGLRGTDENLYHRPRHLRQLLITLRNDADFAPKLHSGPIAVIGHSMGGYTALAAAGGIPWSKRTSQPLTVPHLPNVGPLVLLAPAVSWFVPEASLAAVHSPVLALTAEHDELTPAAGIKAVLSRELGQPGLLSYQQIDNAGHFSFMSPYSASRIKADFPPGQDLQGFDRQAFQSQLQAKVRNFLAEHRRHQCR